MPLHLLGKKSWNVYNADNVARVRRDEAAAQAREEAEEQRMQEQDAERRLAILRGEVPPPLEDTPQDDPLPLHREQDRHSFGGRKRKRAGEDDTDFEMRLAKERAEVGSRVARELAPPQKSLSLVDSKGHISLFGEADLPPQKNEEAEKEAAQKKREYMDQYQMRMANAAGRDGQGLTDGGPWYASADGDAAVSVPSKNVFGKHDPKRKVREATRLDASDPLAMMKRGAAKVKELEKERRKENEERGRELEALKNDERREKKRRRREEHEKREHSHRHRSRSRERERHGSRRDRSRSRNRRRSRSRDRDRDRHQDRDRRESPRNDDSNQNREDRGSHRHRSHRSDNDRHGDRDRSRDMDGEKSRDRHRDRDRDRRSKDTETKEGSRPTQR